MLVAPITSLSGASTVDDIINGIQDIPDKNAMVLLLKKSHVKVLDHPKLAYYYARYIHGLNRSKKMELVISLSAEWSYMYARFVLQNPFPLGEDTISTDPHYSCAYAQKVLKKRFTLGEPAIATSVTESSRYAENILRGRFSEGEETISRYAYRAFHYAVHIIKERFYLGEPAIYQNSDLRARYCYEFYLNSEHGRFVPCK